MTKTNDKVENVQVWQDLLSDRLSYARLIEIVLEGLEATKIKSSVTEPDRVVPDYQVRHKFLETALRLKGVDTREKVDHLLFEEKHGWGL